MKIIVSEAEFQAQIIELGRILGYKVAHFRPAKTGKGWRTAVSGDGAGFVDCVLVKPYRRAIFAELKSEVGKLSDLQQGWVTLLRLAGEEVYVWRPSQLDEIVDILQRKEENDANH
jgi:hypothetical protein